jgi:hypothetical protein
MGGVGGGRYGIKNIPEIKTELEILNILWGLGTE